MSCVLALSLSVTVPPSTHPSTCSVSWSWAADSHGLTSPSLCKLGSRLVGAVTSGGVPANRCKAVRANVWVRNTACVYNTVVLRVCDVVIVEGYFKGMVWWVAWAAGKCRYRPWRHRSGRNQVTGWRAVTLLGLAVRRTCVIDSTRGQGCTLSARCSLYVCELCFLPILEIGSGWVNFKLLQRPAAGLANPQNRRKM
jgi:hypothetical protein